MSEKIRSLISSLVEDLKTQESISSVGLFGSWSRGDAVQGSDIDLLIVDKRDFDYEYIERIEYEGKLIDLDYIPEKWVIGKVPLEVDQKIYEVEALYDPDKKLTRAKGWMLKTYWTQERVDLRTESYLVDAYTYLSRSTSAQNKEDLKSASVYATIGLEEILKTLIEVNMLPVSNSRFIENLESSAKDLGMQEVFDRYLDVSRLSELDRGKVENSLSSLERTWNEAISSIQEFDPLLDKLHIKIRRNLNYYGTPVFLKGLLARSKAMIEEYEFIEAAHYINRTLVNMLENYTWLVLAGKGSRFDYTTLFGSLGSDDSCKTIYENAVKAFRLKDVLPGELEASLEKTKEMVNDIRQRRKELIRRHIKSPT